MEWLQSIIYFVHFYFVFSMENIISVTVYKHISSLIGEKLNKEEDIFDPERVTSTPSIIDF
jgi:hypothetical protein